MSISGRTQYGDRRRGRGGVAVDEGLAVRRHADGVIGVLGRQQSRLAAVDSHLPELLIIRIHAPLAAHPDKPQRARVAVDVSYFGDVAIAGGDRMEPFAGLQVDQIQVAPVVALGEPDRLMGFGQILPVDHAVAAFVVVLDAFLERGAHRAGVGIGDTEPLVPAVARGGNQGQRLAVRRPLQVVPVARRVATDVITKARQALLRRHLEAYRSVVGDIDHHRLNHEHVLVPSERIFPLLQMRMAQPRVDQVHVADLALILLVSSDAFGIR